VIAFLKKGQGNGGRRRKEETPLEEEEKGTSMLLGPASAGCSARSRRKGPSGEERVECDLRASKRKLRSGGLPDPFTRGVGHDASTVHEGFSTRGKKGGCVCVAPREIMKG